MKGTTIKQVHIPQVNAFYCKHGQWYLETCTKLWTRYGQYVTINGHVEICAKYGHSVWVVGGVK